MTRLWSNIFKAKGYILLFLDEVKVRESLKMCNMAILFVVLWVSITIPILLSLSFELLEPIVTVDNTGISMIIIALLIGLMDCYIGIKMLNTLQSWLEKRKRS